MALLRTLPSGRYTLISSNRILLFIISFLFLEFFSYPSPAEMEARIKEIAILQGARGNQLVGYGLVVGLNGTGDKTGTEFTVQTLVNMLERMGVTVDPKDVKVKNVASVMVTSELPAFARVGSQIDILVSSLGDAEDLQGGTLLLTPLKAPDGDTYAVAQGPVSIGGFNVKAGGGGIQKNHPTVGRIPNGAVVEKDLPYQLTDEKKLRWILNNPDFTTASRLSQTINTNLKMEIAHSVDATAIEVEIPDIYANRIVDLIAYIEKLKVIPDKVAKVILDERTGTVVMGNEVRISTVAVAHGNLSVEIKPETLISQPPPLSNGETVVVMEKKAKVEEEKAKLIVLQEGVSITEVVTALNAVGASARDIIAIFQAMKAAGALMADLEII